MTSINLKIIISAISVNVFGYEKLICPLRISKHNYKRESTVNLLLISDDIKRHYCWIKDISKLLSLQTSKRVMLHMCVLDDLILSKPRNHLRLIMSIVNHTML